MSQIFMLFTEVITLDLQILIGPQPLAALCQCLPPVNLVYPCFHIKTKTNKIISLLLQVIV